MDLEREEGLEGREIRRGNFFLLLRETPRERETQGRSKTSSPRLRASLMFNKCLLIRRAVGPDLSLKTV